MSGFMGSVQSWILVSNFRGAAQYSEISILPIDSFCVFKVAVGSHQKEIGIK